MRLKFFFTNLRIVPVITASLFLFVACSVPAIQTTNIEISIPKGWYLSLNNAKVNLIKAYEQKTGYVIDFDRAYSDKDADHYLTIAEGIFPERSMVIKSSATEAKSWFFERLWWDQEYNGYPIPFAITGDAINFYIERYQQVKAERKTELSADRLKGSNSKRIEFTYQAKIIDEGSMVISEIQYAKKRVIMEMKWYEYCGQPCGWGFELHREIVFAGKYQVQSIKGDGTTTTWISNAQQPYGPNQWIRF